MLESHVLNLFKQNTRNGVISFKMRLTLVLLPSELLQHSWDSSHSQDTHLDEVTE